MVFKLIKRLLKNNKDNEEIQALRELVDSYKTYIQSLKNLQELHKQNSNAKIEFLLRQLERSHNEYPGVA
jgi:hypothetical protein